MAGLGWKVDATETPATEAMNARRSLAKAHECDFGLIAENDNVMHGKESRMDEMIESFILAIVSCRYTKRYEISISNAEKEM